MIKAEGDVRIEQIHRRAARRWIHSTGLSFHGTRLPFHCTELAFHGTKAPFLRTEPPFQGAKCPFLGTARQRLGF